MAEALNDGGAPRERSYRARFRLVYVVLALIAAAAVAGIGWAAGRGGEGAGAAAAGTATGPTPGVIDAAALAAGGEDTWSSFRSDAVSLEERLQDLANHVNRHYVDARGEPFVSVLPGFATNGGVPITGIAVREPGTGGVEMYASGATVVYRLVGERDDNAISRGRATPARGALLGLEAFELALTTFRYVPGAQSVLVYPPPPPGGKPDRVMFYRRDELAELLERPLASTVPQGPLRVEDVGFPPRLPAARFALERHFHVSVRKLQNEESVLLLDPTARS